MSTEAHGGAFTARTMTEFAGVAAVITGGSSGIGLATAQLLGARGAAVGIIDRIVTEEGAAFASVAADITDDRAVVEAMRRLADQLGGVDVLINNAGIGAQGGIEANDIDEWQTCFDVNVFGMVRVTRAALPYLRASTRAAVVNTASLVATTGFPERVLYSATKGAVWSMTLAMAADLCGEGIRVNAVAPGTTDTPWVGRLLERSGAPAAERAALSARQPLGRLISAREVAGAIAYLASPEQAATTGTVLAVDGGAHSVRVSR